MQGESSLYLAERFKRSLFSGNEPGNSSLHNGIESYPQLDSFVDLTHSIFGNGGDIEVFLHSTGSLCGG